MSTERNYYDIDKDNQAKYSKRTLYKRHATQGSSSDESNWSSSSKKSRTRLSVTPSSDDSMSTRRSDVEYRSRRGDKKSGLNYHRRSRSNSESNNNYLTRSAGYRNRNRIARERPEISRCIGVFGLNTNTTQHKVREIFNKFGPIERIQMVIDAHTHRSRGFCFIYFENVRDARAAKDACLGMEVDERRIRVDYSITKRAHTPTPGIYMGRPSRYSQGSRDRSSYEKYNSSPRSRRRREDGLSPKEYRSSQYDQNDREYRSRVNRNRSRSRGDRSRSRTPRKYRY